MTPTRTKPAVLLLIAVIGGACGTGTSYSLLLDSAGAYLSTRQDSLKAKYALASYQHYDWDQGTGRITFSDGGVPKLVASVQFVGDVSSKSGTWLWSWGNSTIEDRLTEAARAVRAYGKQHGIVKLATAQWPATEEDGWDMTAIAAFLVRAQGAYRSPGDGGPLFMLLDSVRWATINDRVVHGEDHSP